MTPTHQTHSTSDYVPSLIDSRPARRLLILLAACACASILMTAALIAEAIASGTTAATPAAFEQAEQTIDPLVEVLGAIEERAAASVVPTTPAVTLGDGQPPVTSAPATSSTSTSTSTSTTSTSTSTSTTSTPVPGQVAPVPPAAANDFAQMGTDAEEILGYPWREKFPEWTLTWNGPRDGVRALTFPDTKIVEMYIRPGDDAKYLARVLAHEFGHVADLELNSEEDRQAWREARKLSDDVPWWPTGSAYDFDTGAGDFAEGFAALLVGSDSHSRVAGSLTPAQLAVMAELVR